MRSPRPYHPYLVALFPILSLYAANDELLRPAELLLPGGLALATALLLARLLGRLAGEPHRGALFASLGLGLFWALTPTVRLLQRSLPEGLHAPYAAGFALLVVLLAFALWRLRRSFVPATQVLNAGSAAALLLALAPLATWWLARDRSPEAPEPGPALGVPSLEPPASGRLPDLYYLVLDAYGRADVLRRIYGLEDRLAEGLEELGFYVARESHANYDTTLHSIPSALNFLYLQELFPSRPGRDMKPLVRLVCESRLRRALEPLGYRFVVYDSGYFSTYCPEADRFLEAPRALSELEAVLLEKTPLGLLGARLRPLSPYNAHRRRVLGALDALTAQAAEPGPKLTFVHVLSPHRPFVFGPEGEEVAPYELPFSFEGREQEAGERTAQGRNGKYIELYAGQAAYLAERVLEAVAELLERSPRPPIVVIQGDHGPNSVWPGLDPAERYPILNAYHLPDGGRDLLYPGISPVNTFRVVLDHYFGAGLGLLPDDRYTSNYWQPYQIRPTAEHRPEPRPVSAAPPGLADLRAQPRRPAGSGMCR